VCHVPEVSGVFPSLTVKENILVFARVNGVNDPIETVVEALPSLEAHLNQVAGTLSGGQKQMLALARTCVVKPQLILLDEVSLGLAPKIVDGLFAFLRRLASTGVSLLLVEQYFHRALDLADKVYMLNRGRVVFTGEPSELDADSIIRSYISLDV
jgi:branched-chain amino acid transport system ATP-binding protein